MHAKRWLVAELGRETNFFEAKVMNSRAREALRYDE